MLFAVSLNDSGRHDAVKLPKKESISADSVLFAELFDVRFHLVFVRNLLAQAVVYDAVRFRIQTVRIDLFCPVHLYELLSGIIFPDSRFTA